MPPSYVRTLRDQLFYEFAELISRSERGRVDSRFVKSRFKSLRSGAITPLGILHRWELERSQEQACAFCGATESLRQEPMILKCHGGVDDAENLVWTCATCQRSREDKSVFEWLGLKTKYEVPRIVAGRYLKLLLDWHERAGTLDMDAKAIALHCSSCRLLQVCGAWGNVGKLNCLCTECRF